MITDRGQTGRQNEGLGLVLFPAVAQEFQCFAALERIRADRSDIRGHIDEIRVLGTVKHMCADMADDQIAFRIRILHHDHADLTDLGERAAVKIVHVAAAAHGENAVVGNHTVDAVAQLDILTVDQCGRRCCCFQLRDIGLCDRFDLRRHIGITEFLGRIFHPDSRVYVIRRREVDRDFDHIRFVRNSIGLRHSLLIRLSRIQCERICMFARRCIKYQLGSDFDRHQIRVTVHLKNAVRSGREVGARQHKCCPVGKIRAGIRMQREALIGSCLIDAHVEITDMEGNVEKVQFNLKIELVERCCKRAESV